MSKESKMPESVPSHLKELYDRTGVGMTIEQRNSVCGMLKNMQTHSPKMNKTLDGRALLDTIFRQERHIQ